MNFNMKLNVEDLDILDLQDITDSIREKLKNCHKKRIQLLLFLSLKRACSEIRQKEKSSAAEWKIYIIDLLRVQHSLRLNLRHVKDFDTRNQLRAEISRREKKIIRARKYLKSFDNSTKAKSSPSREKSKQPERKLEETNQFASVVNATNGNQATNSLDLIASSYSTEPENDESFPPQMAKQ